jgi:hypothetical protein
VRRAVRIIFNALYLRGNAVLVPLEIHQAVTLLVPTAAVAHRQSTLVVAPGSLGLLLNERQVR